MISNQFKFCEGILLSVIGSCHLLPAFIQSLQEQRQLLASGIPSSAATEAAVKGFQTQQKMAAAALLMTNKELTVGLVRIHQYYNERRFI